MIAAGIPWAPASSPTLALDDDTFRQMARAYPAVGPLRELRHTLGQLRSATDWPSAATGATEPAVALPPAKTGRNQPSNAKFVFGPVVLDARPDPPGPGQAVAYVDWSQQEFGIAAALSGDDA